MSRIAHCCFWIICTLLLLPRLANSAPPATYDLAGRRELFVDRQQIERLEGSARLKLHEPQSQGVAFVFDGPFEGPISTYVTVFRDGDRVRLYYRGWATTPESTDAATGKSQPNSREDGQQFACYAESKDGITFTRPKLGLVEVHGSKDNNVLLPHRSHNFAPFKDTRPGVPEDQRYKALMTRGSPFPLGKVEGRGLAALASADGLNWRILSEVTVLTDGAFDSQNIAFWDSVRGEYRSYYRIFTNRIREIAWSRSDDFITWGPMHPIVQRESANEHFYTNAIQPYFRAPHYYFAFPKRFMSNRKGLEGHQGISDAVFLSSRDGANFDRTFTEALVRPGRDPLNWGDRSTMPACGLVQTAPDEVSIYYTRHYKYPSNHLVRASWRLDGIASVNVDGSGGEVVSRPFIFKGKSLTLNYATSAAGSVQVEIQQPDGTPIPNFTIADSIETFGDRIDSPFAWKRGTDVSALAGQPVRLRFVLRDADLYSYQFVE